MGVELHLGVQQQPFAVAAGSSGSLRASRSGICPLARLSRLTAALLQIGMFLRSQRRKKDGKVDGHWSIVESRRLGDGAGCVPEPAAPRPDQHRLRD
jgi:hypothetical protein